MRNIGVVSGVLAVVLFSFPSARAQQVDDPARQVITQDQQNIQQDV